MRTTLILFCLVAACATRQQPAAVSAAAPIHDLFGVVVGMPKADVHTKLAAAGTMSREERKRQEVWTVNDPRFQGAIVGYDTDWNVRFITAVAREGGLRVRFAEVLDPAAAEHRSTGTSHNWRWHPAGANYTVVAIGNDPEFLDYVTLTTQ